MFLYLSILSLLYVFVITNLKWKIHTYFVTKGAEFLTLFISMSLSFFVIIVQFQLYICLCDIHDNDKT